MQRPIVVIADDLSGAAELAGIAFVRGLSAEVQRVLEPSSDARVIAIDTDSRSLPAHEAARKVGEMMRQVAALQPAWIFKKVDSLLRGPVRAEIEAMVAATGQARAVLIPANPSRGRTIERGRYLVDGIPLDESPLASDPEHPRRSADVVELLGDRATLPVASLPADDRLPERGLILPDVATTGQMQKRSKEVDAQTLAAGAADFFAALLDERCVRSDFNQSEVPELTFQSPALFVCGSRLAWPTRRQECLSAGVPVMAMPTSLDDEWTDAAARQLARSGKLLIGLGDESSAGASDEWLRRLARTAALVARSTPAETLLVEGGATASALVQQLGWTRFAVTQRSPAGVGVLRPVGSQAPLQLLIKPGSYPWPLQVWERLRRISEG
jgi:uncharacterized protein YgbK (DUF1537 family)